MRPVRFRVGEKYKPGASKLFEIPEIVARFQLQQKFVNQSGYIFYIFFVNGFDGGMHVF